MKKSLSFTILLIINTNVSLLSFDGKLIPFLFNAIAQGNVDDVKHVLHEGYNLYYQQRGTALMAAAQSDPKIVTILLEYGAKPNDQDETGDTALSYALRSNMDTAKTIEIIETLLTAGANPNLANKKGQSPLDLALKNTSLDPQIIRILKPYKKLTYTERVLNWF